MDTARGAAQKSLTRFQEKWKAWIRKARNDKEELGPEEIFTEGEEGADRPVFSRFLGSFSAKERLLLVFVLGIVLGFGAKTMATESITIGYRDYSVAKNEAYDLMALQKKVSENGSGANFSGGVRQGGACAAQ